MILAESTWKEVDLFSRDAVVVIPTGSLEQHGPHLPLFTDSILASAVSAQVEAQLPDQVLLTPCLWLGASGHHLKFSGTLSASFEGYFAAIHSVMESLIPHGFYKFYIVNGHGGNNEPNGIAMRQLKAKYPDFTFGHSGYYQFAEEETRGILEGPFKFIRHACEAEVSLMLHVRPDLVRKDLIRNDGLTPSTPLRGVVHHFDEITEEGSLGASTLGTAEKGKFIFESAVKGVAQEIKSIAEGYVLIADPKLKGSE